MDKYLSQSFVYAESMDSLTAFQEGYLKKQPVSSEPGYHVLNGLNCHFWVPLSSFVRFYFKCV